MPSEKVADLVERLEKIMKAFFEVKHLTDVSVKKYIQNEPAVNASWTGTEDPLSRNINLFCKESNNNECYVDFEMNIWLDDRTAIKRRWLHRYFCTLWVEPYTGEMLPVAMGIMLEKMFNDVTRVKIENLVNVSDLQPLIQ